MSHGKKRLFINIPWNKDYKIDREKYWKTMILLEKKAIRKNDKMYYGYIIFDIDWQNKYPSKKLLKILKVLIIDNTRIVNPLPKILFHEPLTIPEWIFFSHNQLLIIDSVYQNGSVKHYSCENGDQCYSEISGRLLIKDNNIQEVIIHANHNNNYHSDPDTIMPKDDKLFNLSEYIFHTHPNPSPERRRSGIIYEFPSGNDLLNFANHYKPGTSKTIGSLLITPEGLYFIKPFIYYQPIKFSGHNCDEVNKLLISLEHDAGKKYPQITPSIFYNNIIHDYSYIDKYNKFIRQFNLQIDFIPRMKVIPNTDNPSLLRFAYSPSMTYNHTDLGIWYLQPFYLPKV